MESTAYRGVMAAARMVGDLLNPWAPRIVGRRTRPLDWNRPHQGKQEMARRQRQIERGQLTASNGLVDTHRVDSHGRVVRG